MLLPNGIDAVCFDQGALIVGLVPVPLHIIDTPANCAYILEDSDTKLLVTVNRARWHAIQAPAPICLSSAQSSTSMMNPNLKAKRFAALTLLNG